jgi:hypothetical protein
MQDNREDVEPPLLRFAVIPAKKSSIGGLLLRILDGAAGATGPDAGYRYPEVAAFNSKGTRRVIEVTDTDDEAHERISAVEDDFRTLTIEAWCDRYGIPLSFVTE